MDLSVMALPVKREKVEALRLLLAGLNGARRAQTAEVHRQADVLERGYLQALGDGSYLYVAVFESEEPATALQRVMTANAADADYGPWIFSQLEHVFGMDRSQGLPPMPELVYDSGQP